MLNKAVCVKLLYAVAAAIAAGGAVAAQQCPDSSDTFWKNDKLPDIPGGAPVGISIIPGLCEGEAAGSVFKIPPGAGPMQLTQVAAPFAAPGGAPGFVAAVNVEIFDGITWLGDTPVLGTKVFDLNADVGVDMQVTSTGVNVFDASPYGITVGNGTSAFVVAFRMNLNLNGSCATGYTANFFTDNDTFGFTCDPLITLPKTNLIDIQGQGWADAGKATVGGFPLCPFFYSGNWVIRACTQGQSGPPTVQPFGSGCGAGTAGWMGTPQAGGPPFVVDLSGGPALAPAVLAIGASDSNWGGAPLPLDLAPFGAPGCELLTGLQILIPAFTDFFGSVTMGIPIPSDPYLVGATVYTQWMASDPGANALGWVFSGGLSVTIQP